MFREDSKAGLHETPLLLAHISLSGGQNEIYTDNIGILNDREELRPQRPGAKVVDRPDVRYNTTQRNSTEEPEDKCPGSQITDLEPVSPSNSQHYLQLTLWRLICVQPMNQGGHHR